VVRDFDRARAAADTADAAWRAASVGMLRPADAVKEQFNIAGLPTTWAPNFKIGGRSRRSGEFQR